MDRLSRRNSSTSISTATSQASYSHSPVAVRSLSTDHLLSIDHRFVKKAIKPAAHEFTPKPRGTYYFPNGEVFRPRSSPSRRNRPSKLTPSPRANSLSQVSGIPPQNRPQARPRYADSPPMVPPRSYSLSALKRPSEPARSPRNDFVPSFDYQATPYGYVDPSGARQDFRPDPRSGSVVSLDRNPTALSDSNLSSLSNYNLNRSSSNTPQTSISNDECDSPVIPYASSENLSTLREEESLKIGLPLADSSDDEPLDEGIVMTPAPPRSRTRPSPAKSAESDVAGHIVDSYHEASSVYSSESFKSLTSHRVSLSGSPRQKRPTSQVYEFKTDDKLVQKLINDPEIPTRGDIEIVDDHTKIARLHGSGGSSVASCETASSTLAHSDPSSASSEPREKDLPDKPPSEHPSPTISYSEFHEANEDFPAGELVLVAKKKKSEKVALPLAEEIAPEFIPLPLSPEPVEIPHFTLAGEKIKPKRSKPLKSRSASPPKKGKLQRKPPLHREPSFPKSASPPVKAQPYNRPPFSAPVESNTPKSLSVPARSPRRKNDGAVVDVDRPPPRMQFYTKELPPAVAGTPANAEKPVQKAEKPVEPAHTTPTAPAQAPAQLPAQAPAQAPAPVEPQTPASKPTAPAETPVQVARPPETPAQKVEKPPTRAAPVEAPVQTPVRNAPVQTPARSAIEKPVEPLSKQMRQPFTSPILNEKPRAAPPPPTENKTKPFVAPYKSMLDVAPPVKPLSLRSASSPTSSKEAMPSPTDSRISTSTFKLPRTVKPAKSLPTIQPPVEPKKDKKSMWRRFKKNSASDSVPRPSPKEPRKSTDLDSKSVNSQSTSSSRFKKMTSKSFSFGNLKGFMKDEKVPPLPKMSLHVNSPEKPEGPTQDELDLLLAKELTLTKLPTIETEDDLFDDLMLTFDEKLEKVGRNSIYQPIVTKTFKADTGPFLKDDELTKDQIEDQRKKDDSTPTLQKSPSDNYVDEHLESLRDEMVWPVEDDAVSIHSEHKIGELDFEEFEDESSFVLDGHQLNELFEAVDDRQRRKLPMHLKYIKQFKDYEKVEINCKKFETQLAPKTPQDTQLTSIVRTAKSKVDAKKVDFSNKISINETFSPDMYSRYNKSVTQYFLTEPTEINRMKNEVNNFKCNEMLVHEQSQHNTHFFY